MASKGCSVIPGGVGSFDSPTLVLIQNKLTYFLSE